MTTSMLPGVPVRLNDGQTYQVRFTRRALVVAERELKRSIFDVFQAYMGLDATMTLLWAGLLHERPGLRLEQVYDLTEGLELSAVLEPIMEALKVSLGLDRAGEGDQGNAPAG